MKMSLNRAFSFFILFLLFSISIYAQPPFQEGVQTAETGSLIIEYPIFLYYTLESKNTIHFHVYNTSGALIPNSEAMCNFHLYSEDKHIEQLELERDPNGNDFEYDFNLSNIKSTGIYSFVVWCNSTKQYTGFLAGGFEITDTGKEIDHRFNYAILGGVFIVMFILIAFMHSFRKDQGALVVYGTLGSTICFLTIWAYLFDVLYLPSGLKFFINSLLAGMGLYMGIMAHFFYKDNQIS